MAIFLLGPDPNGNCCDCNGRTSPCDSCCEFLVSYDGIFAFQPDANMNVAPSLAAAEENMNFTTRNCKIFFDGLRLNPATINSTTVTESSVAVNVTKNEFLLGPLPFIVIFTFRYWVKISLAETTTLRFEFNSDSGVILVGRRNSQEPGDVTVFTNRRVAPSYEETYNAGEYNILMMGEYSLSVPQSENSYVLSYISSITAKDNKKLGLCNTSMYYMDGLEKKVYTCEES